MKTDKEKIAAVFAEWKRQFDEAPEEFLPNDFTEDYVEDCTQFFISTHNQLFPESDQ